MREAKTKEDAMKISNYIHRVTDVLAFRKKC